MKELSIEEKAKRYDEAIKLAKDSYSYPSYPGFIRADVVFPELKESEDERIRKAIIEFFELQDDNTTYSFVPKKDIIAWLEKQGEKHIDRELSNSLNRVICRFINDPNIPYSERDEVSKKIIPYVKQLEKQGEQKPADKVVSKFKAGDWVVWDNKISCHIDNIYQGKESLMYTITDINNMTRSYSVKGFDNNAHLWTIQDAKDGDVLVCGDFGYTSLMLFESFSNVRIPLHCWYDSQTNNFHINTDVSLRKDANIYPATKEQRDTFFVKMKEAGYEWDDINKRLKRNKNK